jgi:hypothetical protein
MRLEVSVKLKYEIDLSILFYWPSISSGNVRTLMNVLATAGQVKHQRPTIFV